MIGFAKMITTALFLNLLLLSASFSEDTVKEDLGSHQLQRLVDLLTVHECEELLMTLSNPKKDIDGQLFSENMNQILLPSWTLRDTVKEDLGSHQLQRLVDLLTVHECEELLMTLSNPKKDIDGQLFSENMNQILLPSWTLRDTGYHCHPTLIQWLKSHGEQMYYDRLSRALQSIGRTDIAIEMGKNINQDKTLAMQRYVEEYHEQVNKMAFHLTHPSAEKTNPKDTHHSAKQVRSLSWKNLDLVVERQPMPPYQRNMLDGVWPLFYGLVLGVGGALLLGVPLLLFILHLSVCDLSGEA